MIMVPSFEVGSHDLTCVVQAGAGFSKQNHLFSGWSRLFAADLTGRRFRRWLFPAMSANTLIHYFFKASDNVALGTDSPRSVARRSVASWGNRHSQ